MNSLSDLPIELIVAIASHLRYPYETLQLILANHHIYHTCLHLLYKHITLDFRAAYRSSPNFVLTNYRSRQVGQGGVITRLSSLLSQPGVYLGSGVHSLDLTLELNAKCPDFGLRALLPHLHNLRHLRLSVERALDLDGRSPMANLSARSFGSDIDPRKTLSARSLGSVLVPVRKTLKSLCICADHDYKHRDGSSIGDLSYLTSLESLSIQSHVLFSERSTNWTKSLQQILPLTIQELLFDCREDDYAAITGSWKYPLQVSAARAETVCFMLDNLLMRSPEVLQDLRKITLLLSGAPLGHKFPERMVKIFERWNDIQAKSLERGMRLELKTFLRQGLLTTNSSLFLSHQRPYYLETPLPRS